MASESLENRSQKVSKLSGAVTCQCGHRNALHVESGHGFCVRCDCNRFSPAGDDPKACERCGNDLTGFESLGKVCNACLDNRPQIRFVGVGKNVMQGQECKAVACSKNMAKRIANALNVYQPSREGC